LTRKSDSGFEYKKINTLIQSNNLLDCFRDTLCYVSNSSIICTNGTQINRYSSTDPVLDPYVVGNDGAIGVGWRDIYGHVYYGNFNTDQVSLFSFTGSLSETLKTNNFKISLDTSLVSEILTLDASQNIIQTLSGVGTRIPTPLFGFLGYSSTDFSWGRDVFQNTWSCNVNSGVKCFFSDTNQNFPPLTAASFTTIQSISEVTYAPVLDKSSGLYITQAMVAGQQINNTVKYLGVPWCYTGSFSGSCSFASIPLIENIPVLQSVTQVSLGRWGACAVSGGSLTCWGSYNTNFGNSIIWNTFTSVTRVSMYDSGGCVQYINSGVQLGKCWGPLSLSFNQYSFSTQLFSITQPVPLSCPVQNIAFRDICFECNFGETLNSTTQFLQCLDCTSLSGFPSARGPNDLGCVNCSLGSTTSEDKSRCVACPLNSFRGFTMTQCVECGAGSQSAANFQSCVVCPVGTARELGQNSCSTCPLGSIPSNDRTSCISCPQPQIFVGNPPVCQQCPIGQNALDGQCVLCQTPNFRSQSMADCTSCPQGTEPSSDFTFCVPCPASTVRKNTSKCYLCPTGTEASEDKTQCVKTAQQSLRFFLSVGKSASILTGLLVLLLCSILRSMHKITHAQSLAGYFMGCLIACGAFLI